MNLLGAMDAAGCRRIVFSSSATAYGEAHYLPFDENHSIAPTNPYGRTKAMAEGVIADWTRATPDASAVLLRYFNPVGAHESGRIGEDPRGIPNNLMPFVAQVAIGRRDKLAIFGDDDDYDTRDGTGERDYMHVVYLADAHLAALDYSGAAQGCEAINVGAGRGITVMALIAAYERACGHSLATEIVTRRAGDVASSYAATQKATDLLNWNAKLGSTRCAPILGGVIACLLKHRFDSQAGLCRSRCVSTPDCDPDHSAVPTDSRCGPDTAAL